MRRREGGDAENVHVFARRLARGLFGRRKQWADLHFEAEIGKGGGDHLLAAVVSVLADLCDQDTRPASLNALESGDALRHPLGCLRDAELACIDAGDRLQSGLMAAVDLFQRR